MPLLIARLALLLAVVIAGPTALKLWMDHSDDAVRQVMPRITAPSPSVPAAFDSCRDLRKRHPGGVRSPGDRNDGRKLAEKPAVDAAAAVASRRLDKDRDGLVCEVARSRKPR